MESSIYIVLIQAKQSYLFAIPPEKILFLVLKNYIHTKPQSLGRFVIYELLETNYTLKNRSKTVFMIFSIFPFSWK